MSTGISLYEIEHKRAELFDALTSDDEATRKQAEDELAAIKEVRDDKLTACCAYLKNLRAEAGAIELEMERLQAKLAAANHRAAAFEDYIRHCIGEGEKWKSSLHSIGWRKSEAVEIPAGAKIPDQYCRTEIISTPDKKQIALDLKNGLRVDWAKLVTRQHLQVK